jgi:hypothetical protein
VGQPTRCYDRPNHHQDLNDKSTPEWRHEGALCSDRSLDGRSVLRPETDGSPIVSVKCTLSPKEVKMKAKNYLRFPLTASRIGSILPMLSRMNGRWITRQLD